MKNVALITGAANGIGFEFAKIAFRDGYDLALVDINEDGLESRKNELANISNGSVHCLAINLDTYF